MKTDLDRRMPAHPPRLARIAGWLAAGLLGAVLAAAAFWPGFAEWIWKVTVVNRKETLILAGAVVLWGAAVKMGLMVRRRGRGEGRWRTLTTLALLMTAAVSSLCIGLIVVLPYAGYLFGGDEMVPVLSLLGGSLPKADYGVIALAGSLGTAGAFCLGALAWRVGARARHGVVAWLLVLPVGMYLARDDAEWRDAIELAEFAPHETNALAAAEILLRHARGGEAARIFKEPDLFRGKRLPAVASAEWVEWIAENRGEVAEAWAEMLPVRTWWAEWNRYPAVADTTVSWESMIPNFSVMRAYSRAACAEASARALEGRGDEAVELLVPLIEGAGKLQAHSIVLVRAMIAVVLRGMAVDTAGLVVERGEPSPAARERLREAVAATLGGEAGVRRMMAGEFALQLQWLRQMEKTAAEHPFGWSVSLLFNPRRTHNEISALVAKLMELAARRDGVALNGVLGQFTDRSRQRSKFKNQSGRALLEMMIPSYGKVVESYWKTEDASTALLERLAQPAATENPVNPVEVIQP